MQWLDFHQTGDTILELVYGVSLYTIPFILSPQSPPPRVLRPWVTGSLIHIWSDPTEELLCLYGSVFLGCSNLITKTEVSGRSKIRSFICSITHVQPILNLCYKLNIYIIQGPSQNASWSSLQRNLFTLYKTLHTWSSIHQTLSPAKANKKKQSHFLHVLFPTRSCVFLCYHSPLQQSSAFISFFIFRHAVTKSQSTGQLLNYSVRQEVHKSSVRSLRYLTCWSSSKTFQRLYKWMDMNSNQWKSKQVFGWQSKIIVTFDHASCAFESII